MRARRPASDGDRNRERRLESTSLPAARQRLAAAATFVFAAAIVAGVLIAVARDPVAGLVALAGVTAGVLLAWQGAVRRGVTRALGLGAAVLAVVAVLVVLKARNQAIEFVVVGAGILAATAAVRIAFKPHGRAAGVWQPVAAPERPVLLVNPRSGGGKAGALGIPEAARARGIEVAALEPGDDLATLARRAVAGGADMLGMAGGDGSMATVAALAAEHALPFVVVPTGTRNHLALDLGIDRDDPIGALNAFSDGVERRIDLAEVNGRVFVNNVSIGVYARAVHARGYRDAKLRTLLDTLAEVLGPDAPQPPLRLTDDEGRTRTDVVLVLVANNPYVLDRALGRGTRPRLDSGRLGILVMGPPSLPRPLRRRDWAAPAFEVAATTRCVRAGADGEAIALEQPLRFTIRPGAVRVRIAACHPGLSPSALLPGRGLDTVVHLARIAAGRGAGRRQEP